MPEVKASTNLPVPAQTVWGVIGGFNALPDWHPAVEKSEVAQDGGNKVRTLTLAGGGGSIVERLDQIDDNERLYTYSILSGPLPVANYTSTIRVKDNGSGGCTVEWGSEFNAEGAPESAAVAAIRGVYETGFENLRKMFGG